MPPVSRRLSELRLDLHALEDWAKEYWRSIGLEDRLRFKGNGPKFYFLDGPPYASARSVHPGTVWNKVLKDVVIRYKRMQGYDVWARAGYDTHGLPIEVKVEQALGLGTKKEIEEVVGVERFVEECRRFVDENISSITEQFKEVAASLEWTDPYVTYTDEYIEAAWWLVKRVWERGLLTREHLVVHWCPRCETTLADYEVSEYVELEDPSIYVKLRVRGQGDRFLLVWTTTPWTIPANAFVMASPRITYAEVEVNGEVLIMARRRVEAVMREAGIGDYKVLRELEGRELEGLEYEHPLEDVIPAQEKLRPFHRVVLAEEGVSEHEGTGLVHSAPGHGEVDQAVGARIGCPALSLVDEKGRMTRDAGPLAGTYFRTEANRAVVEMLKGKGALLHAGTVVHRYPVCWRCKTPLVLRATTQWVFKTSELRRELEAAADSVEWRPEWAKTRFLRLLEEPRDWVVSRQRYWGIPLPVWTCESCGRVRVIESLGELEEMCGVRVPNAHRPWVDRVVLRCDACGGSMRRVPDVLDVWLDSGIAFYAGLGFPRRNDLFEKLMPVDFVVEGHDQIRGWFFSLLRCGVLAFGKPPMRTVLVHGFMLDEQGREMHKSLGNYVELSDILRSYSRDTLRLTMLSNTVWEDLRFSYRLLDLAKRDLTIALNVFAFASTYMGLDEFDPYAYDEQEVLRRLTFADRWMLSRLNRLVKEYMEAMETYEVHRAARALRSFIVDDVSHWYVRLIRRRVWTEEDTWEKRAAYYTLYKALRTWVLLAAPFVPHLAEFLYVNFVASAEPSSTCSVHLERVPPYDTAAISDEVEKRMAVAKEVVEEALRLRMRAGINVRRPLKALYLSEGLKGLVDEEVAEVIREQANVKRVEIVERGLLEGLKRPVARPLLPAIGRAFRSLAPVVAGYVNANAEAVARDVLSIGEHVAHVNGVEIRLTREHVVVDWEELPGFLIGRVLGEPVVLNVSVDQELYLEGLAREVVRRAQVARKMMGLPVEAFVRLCVAGSEEVREAVRVHEAYVRGEVRALEVRYEECEGYRTDWDIDGLVVHLFIEPLRSSEGPRS